MNLPRSVRFKRENVILVSILPGPSEPKRDIYMYMEPLVEEMEDLRNGVRLSVNSCVFPLSIIIQCALLCVACDLSAGCKLCFFISLCQIWLLKVSETIYTRGRSRILKRGYL